MAFSAIAEARVLRIAFDGAHTYGRKGAHWYAAHHALARRLSIALDTTVHAYVLDPEELEQVTTYAAGRRVGGDRIRYEDAELDGDSLDDLSFEGMKARWPLGHLATVLGVQREKLVKVARMPTVLLDLDGASPDSNVEVTSMFPVDSMPPQRLSRVSGRR